jgi:hypothetical protein
MAGPADLEVEDHVGARTGVEGENVGSGFAVLHLQIVRLSAA